jgi:hypothetical protein
MLGALNIIVASGFGLVTEMLRISLLLITVSRLTAEEGINPSPRSLK